MALYFSSGKTFAPKATRDYRPRSSTFLGLQRMYEKTLSITLGIHAGSLKVINASTHQQDGFRLYSCTPIHYQQDGKIERFLDPELRFKANKRFNGQSIRAAIQQKKSAVCFQLMMNILNRIIFTDIQVAQHKHKVLMNELWSGLTKEHQAEVVKAIYEKKPLLLSSKESIANTLIEGSHVKEFFQMVCHNHPIRTPSSVAPQNASHFIFIDADVFQLRHGKESVALYPIFRGSFQ